ncbi:MAG: neutral zinc metallopeptidase [Candidatus Competibacteraceae bacterium]|nr:MAG: neutral zinc metallopeptidase [Candidatus Competibacteraceae bacterium]
MRWRDLRRSSNVEDRRDESPSVRRGGGGIKLGGGGGLLLVMVASPIFGVDPMGLKPGDVKECNTFVARRP